MISNDSDDALQDNVTAGRGAGYGEGSNDEHSTEVAPPESDTAAALGAVGTSNAAGMASFGGIAAGMPGAIIGGVPADIEQGLAAETDTVDADIEEFRRIARSDQADS